MIDKKFIKWLLRDFNYPWFFMGILCGQAMMMLAYIIKGIL